MKLATPIYKKVRKMGRRWSSGGGKTTLPSDNDPWNPDSDTISEEFTVSPSSEFGENMESADFSVTTSTEFAMGLLPKLPPVFKKDSDAGDSDATARDPDRRRSPRVVFFDEEVLVRRIRPAYQIGGNIDRRELWYQDDEYKEINWKARRLVKRALNLADNEQNEKYCLRGLEHVTNSVKRKAKANLDGREAVLDEQLSQFEEDVFPLDDIKIASVYAPYTQPHRAQALERAKWDATEVELYQQSNDPTSPTPPPPQSVSMSIPSNSSHSSLPQHPPLLTPQTVQKKSFSAASPFQSPTSPLFPSPIPGSPSLVNKPGMMFTYIDRTIQYPPGMKLDSF